MRSCTRNVHEIAVDPDRELAEDWKLFQSVETGVAEYLCRSWCVVQPVVVVGRHRTAADEVIEEACREDDVPVLRRSSGGGTVVLGHGCLNYAVALSLVSRAELSEVAVSFRYVLEAIVRVLAVPGLSAAGGTDLALNGRKVSGSAQCRGRRGFLHHGTLLYDFDARLATRYLREPVRQPAYRAARRHADFLGNLPLSGDTVRARLEAALISLLR